MKNFIRKHPFFSHSFPQQQNLQNLVSDLISLYKSLQMTMGI